jgi:hypothetical protein
MENYAQLVFPSNMLPIHCDLLPLSYFLLGVIVGRRVTDVLVGLAAGMGCDSPFG